MKPTQGVTHWICKTCKTANHITRKKCLSCDKERSIVEARGEYYEKLAKELGLKIDYTIGMTLREQEISKEFSKFNNGEYP